MRDFIFDFLSRFGSLAFQQKVPFTPLAGPKCSFVIAASFLSPKIIAHCIFLSKVHLHWFNSVISWNFSSTKFLLSFFFFIPQALAEIVE